MARVRRNNGPTVEKSFDECWLDFDSIIDSQKRNTKNTLIDKCIIEWNRRRLLVYNKKEVDHYHVCTFETCKDSIQALSQESNLWGCITSGKTHLCTGDEKCRCTIINKDGIVTCLYSGAFITSVIETNPYKKSDTGKESYQSDSENEIDYVSGGSDNENYEVKEVIPKKGRKREFSIPITDADIPEDGEPIVAPLEKKAKQRRDFDVTNGSNLIQQAESIVTDILFNKSARKKINAKKEKELYGNAIDKVISYYKDCKKEKVYPSLIRADDIFEHEMNKKMLCPILEHDPRMIRMYAEKIYKLWRVLLHSPYFEENQSRFHFKEHVVASLYMLQYGYTVTFKDRTRLTIFEKDSFLYNNLPSESDLESITCASSTHSMKTYKKTNITDGKNNIQKAINSVLPGLKEILIQESLL